MPKCALCSQLQNPPRLTVDPLLDASSALTKGGQVMFCPQPLLQLPKLPSHVQQCRSARFAASYKTLLGLLWTRYWMLAARSQKEDK